MIKVKKTPFLKKALNLNNSKYNSSYKKNQPLISAKRYYYREVKKLSRPTKSDGWGICLCCFHDDHNPSLAVNLHHGGFKCFSCGVSGSMINFQMKKYNQSYKDAVNTLKI
ncbi:MAG: CHC2 zinc finger domain-containing protein [Alphaproteobacteria bacterium]